MLETTGSTHSIEPASTLQSIEDSFIDTYEQEIQSLLDEIQHAVNQYTGSLNSLSQKSGVDPKTIRKIKNGEYKRSPNAETVQRLLSVVSKQRTLKDIANFYGGKIASFLQRAFPQFFLEDAELYSTEELVNDLNAKIKDVYCYQMVKVVKGCDGVPKHELLNTLCKFLIKNESELFEEYISEEDINKFKPLASLKLNNMIKSGLLVEDRTSGKIKLYNADFNWRLPYELCRKYEGSSLNFIQDEHVKHLDYFWRIVFGYVSYKEVNEISHIMWDAFNKSEQIIKSSKGKDIKVNLNSVFNSLKFHTPGEAREESIERRRQLGKL